MADNTLNYQSYGTGAGIASPASREQEVTRIEKTRKLNPRLVSLLKPNSSEAERYRQLRYKVENLKSPGGAVVLGITSPIPGDGKTLTSLNLAGALSQDPSARVLLIELDLRHPYTNIKDYLGIGASVGAGVVDWIQDGATADKITYSLPEYNLNVIPSGRKCESPYEALKSARLGQLLEEARHQYDYILVDTPPVAPLPDSQLVARWVDGFMVVVAANKTPKKLLEEALNQMDPDKVLGLVFNGYSPKHEKYYGYY